MKKAVVFIFAFLSFVMVAKGQTGQRQSQSPEQRVQTFMAEVKKQMSLPEEKLVKVEKLYTDFYKDLAEMRQASQGSFDREKMAQHRQKLSEQLALVLTKVEHDKLVEIETSQRRQGRPTP
jgi:flagellar biosynthesis component FlhA